MAGRTWELKLVLALLAVGNALGRLADIGRGTLLVGGDAACYGFVNASADSQPLVTMDGRTNVRVRHMDRYLHTHAHPCLEACLGACLEACARAPSGGVSIVAASACA